MAVEYIAWALNQKTDSASEKLLLVTLANYANEHGRCFPSQQTLADVVQVSKRTVMRTLSKLEEQGVIRRESRGKKGGGRSTDSIYLNIEAKVTQCHLRGGKGDTGVTIKGDIAVSGDINRQSEPSVITPISPLPVSAELWEEYKNHRKEKKSPLTATAESRAIKKLERMRASGQDPTQVVEQTLENGWTGLFELKEQKNETDRKLSASERNQLSKLKALEELGVEIASC